MAETRRQTKQHWDFYASWPDEARACMDYLHGCVADDEHEAACFYEYARESAILRDTAATRDGLFSQRKKHGSTGHLYREVARTIEQKRRCGRWFIHHPWRLIWRCRSFPGKSWNQLSRRERADILRVFPTTKIQPLLMNHVMTLDALGVFDEFKAMAAEVEELEKTPTNRKLPANLF